MVLDPNEITPIGKTYGEIDADKVQDVRAANEALASMRDKGGRWWRYSVSHCTFELVVGDPAGKDNLVVCLTACDYVAGPVFWPNQQLLVIFHCDRSKPRLKWEFVLQDESVGFRVHGYTFDWARNFDLLKHGSSYFGVREEGI